MKIIPSILESSTENIINQLRKLKPFFTRIQIDIADGSYVPNKTIELPTLIHILVNLPDISQYILDFHLMTNQVSANLKLLRSVQSYLRLGIVFIHRPSFQSQHRVDTDTFRYGLVLNPEDSVASVAKEIDLHSLSEIQIMTVHPGFQGQVFIQEELNKIDQLRSTGYRSHITIDGGVNDETLSLILQLKHLPDSVVVGSYFSKSNDIQKSVEKLKKSVKESAN